jgi:hypothetical protein
MTSALTYFNARMEAIPSLTILPSDVGISFKLVGSTNGRDVSVLSIVSNFAIFPFYISFDGKNKHIRVLAQGPGNYQCYDFKKNGMILSPTGIWVMQDGANPPAKGQAAITMLGI